ncbi:PTS ascorbate transporter subunit IIC [Paenalkalicoccus suaedae]|uniref:Ascorbate-specific PTS system EIIC component n=1 Tax=Paenalkalicoccus suaedae TaxID=2592382 RepID=A0A859FAX0_9BACI|nr:PTS ascorbate transporter subunit IIC [Paenalkalicoccus suaedae]QKS69791.1 PTS ascorbate transporter subunit IIC [Paenalkalicoccus suaedae]
MDFIQLIISEVFRQPPILLGLIAMLGLLLQKKPFSDVVKGTALTAIGVLILTIGTDIIVSSILPIQNAVTSIAVDGSGEEVAGSIDILADYGGAIGIAMMLAFLANVLVARFTKINHIFLTGHMLFWFPYIFVAVAVENQFSYTGVIIFATIASALYFIIVPALLTPFVTAVTGDRSFTLGHPAGFLAITAALIARVVGNKERSTEDLQLPKSLGFFREVAITGGLVVFIVYIAVGFTIGLSAMDPETDMTLFTFALTNGLTFGAGLTIMLSGVRMVIQQILPAFKGISDKLVPNAIPALDAPIIFTYRPNAVIIGFVVAMFVSTALIVLINTQMSLAFLLLPLVVTSFFECGTAAVLAEGQGGLRGAIIGTVGAAVLMVVLLAVSIPIFSTTIADWMLIFGGNDFSLFGWFANLFAGLLGG